MRRTASAATPAIVLGLAIAAGGCRASSEAPSRPGETRRPLVIEEVRWTELVNCDAYGSTLVKTGGVHEYDDAGAFSEQLVLEGDAYVEVTVSEPDAFRWVGLTADRDSSSMTDLDFALRFQAGYCDAYENGAWRAQQTCQTGDVLRIAVESQVVRYYRNGSVFHTSTTRPSYPLYVGARLIDAGSTIADARLATQPSSPPAGQHRFCGWTLATGYVTPDIDPGFLTFATNAADFDAIHPVWWHIGADITSFARIYGEGAPIILDQTTYAGAPTLLIPTIAAVGAADVAKVRQMLRNPAQRSAHIASIVNLVLSRGYDGIDLDYEGLNGTYRTDLSVFVAELADALHATGKTLSLAVGGVDGTGGSSVYDYAALSAAADQLHIMGYDFHWTGSHGGPISPLGWIERVANSIATRREKFILGLPNYGMAWNGSSVNWIGSGRASLSLAGPAYATTTEHEMQSCVFDGGRQMRAGRAPNAWTGYGRLYFDDLASLEEKVAVAREAGLGGITYWTVGGEPDQPGPLSFFAMVRSYFPR